MSILASFDAAKYCLGKPCNKNHFYNDTQLTLRYLKSKQCVECARNRTKANYSTEKQAKYRQENRDRIRENAQKRPKKPLTPQQKARKAELARQRRLNNPAVLESEQRAREKYLSKPENQERIRLAKAKYEKRRQLARTDEDRAARNAYLRLLYATSDRYKTSVYRSRAKYLANPDNRLKKRLSGREYGKRVGKINYEKHKAKLIKYRNDRAKKLKSFCDYTSQDLAGLLSRYNYQCFYCGVRFGKQARLNWDHVIPVSKGGIDTVFNLVPSCKQCNCQKFNFDAIRWYSEQPFFIEDGLLKIKSFLENLHEAIDVLELGENFKQSGQETR